MFANRFARLVAFAVVILAPVLAAQSPDTSKYLLPPQPIIDAFDAQPIPEVIVSPSRLVLAITTRKGNPSLAELAQPVLRLAGARVNPKNYAPHRTRDIYALSLKKIADGSEVKVTLPAQANLANFHFSPDG